MKKTISLIMCLLVALAMIPMATGVAFADETVTEVTEIPTNDIADGVDVALDGAITYDKTGKISEENHVFFDQAFEGWAGVGYTPKKLVGTQVVAGRNLVFLCEANPVYPGAEKTLKLVTIYVDLQNECSVAAIDEYVSPAIKVTTKVVKLKKGGKGIRVNWADKAGNGLYFDKYIVYRAVGKSGKFTKVKTTTNKTFLNTNVKAGKTYYYKVQGVFNNVKGFNKTSAKVSRKMTK